MHEPTEGEVQWWVGHDAMAAGVCVVLRMLLLESGENGGDEMLVLPR